MAAEPRVIGIDVGGTKIAAGVIDPRDGAVLHREVVPTQPERGGEAVLDDTLALAERLFSHASAGGEVIGIGLGVCELVDGDGTITSGHTVPWVNLRVRERLSAIAPTVIEADVRAHALAEAHYGAGRAFDQWVFVSVGTGISSCLVLQGRPHAGVHGNALVLASSPVTTTCEACGTRSHPVLEAFASGPALVERYNAATGARLTRAEQVLAALEVGDNEARAVVESAGEALGVALGWLVNVLDPEALVIGGGLGMASGVYWEAMEHATRAHIWAASSRDLFIRRAALGIDAGIVGAAASFQFHTVSREEQTHHGRWPGGG